MATVLSFYAAHKLVQLSGKAHMLYMVPVVLPGCSMSTLLLVVEGVEGCGGRGWLH